MTRPPPAGAPSRWTAARRPLGWTVLDAGLAAVFLLVLVTEILPNPEMTPHAPLVVTTVLMVAPIGWRTSWPGPVAVLAAAAHLAMSALSTGPFAPQLTVLPLLVVLYSAASRLRGAAAAVTGALTLALTVAAWLVTEEGAADDFWPWLLWAGAWAAGTFVRRRSDLAADHASRAALLEVEARTAGAESAQAERDRIARELHDIVAHSVSVMVVQAGAERLRLGADAGRTGEALAAIEESGRLALTELRSMLGVMRSASTQQLAPLPELAAIPALVERVRRTGLPVELECRPTTLLDDPARSPAAGLAAYRIVQEALTNVVRHAGAVRTVVRLEGGPTALTVEVCNERPADSVHRDPASGEGRGLVGMRERAAALGGSCEAGPSPDGGFRVRAVLPVRPTPRTTPPVSEP